MTREFLLHILERKVTARANLKLLIRKTMTMKIMNKENMTISADFVEKFWEIAQLIKVKSVYLQCFLRRWRMTREFLLHILQMKVSFYPSLLPSPLLAAVHCFSSSSPNGGWMDGWGSQR